jgi:DNA-binding HxlR family transcriptional regulator
MEEEAKTVEHTQAECLRRMLAVKDTVNVLEGRWKVLIIVALSFGSKRFKDLSRDLSGITDKSLSRELKDLEMNKLITRTVYDTFPPMVEYAITPHGASLEKVVRELGHWGEFHRKEIIGK